jgi:hypothetical protein
MDTLAVALAGMQHRIDREWVGLPCVCVATGPSLSEQQLEMVRAWRARDGCRVIAINDNYQCMPWADALYFADHRWWELHRDRPAFRAFRGRKISIENGAGKFTGGDVTVLRNLSFVGGTMGRLSIDPTGIYTGQNSGYQAINVAVLYGCRLIILVGYDMRAGEVRGTNGVEFRHHWFGEHPWRTEPGTYLYFRQEFARMAPTAALNGIRILNATPGSALDAFPMVDLARLVADS